ncbi:MAG: class I SAM-dependent methyltransferase [Thermoanaerobaculia bacterium]
MKPRDTPRDACAYWDSHHHKSHDPSYWMAYPACRAAINRRVTGSAEEWPLDWLRRVHARVPFARGLSWGCGTGAFERSAVRAGIVSTVDGYDISEASLAEARRGAEEEGLSGIRYLPGDFDDPRLPRNAYDAVFFHQSLHHVSRLERLFEAVAGALVANGALYADEYVGPSRNRWKPEHVRRAQELLDRLPVRAKIPRRIDLPIEEHDPSEAARSGEIPSFLRDYFDPVEWKPYGGQIVSLVFPYLRPAWMQSEAGRAAVADMLRVEDEELRADPSTTYYLVAFGRLRQKAPGLRRFRFSRRRRGGEEEKE